MRKWLLLLESGLLVGGLLLSSAVWQQRAALEQPLRLAEERLLEVPSGATPGGLLNRLQDEGLLHGSFWLRLYWRFNLSEQGMRSGEYRLEPGMTAAELLELWQRGEVVQYNLTLVEGWSFRQVRAALARTDKLEQSLEGVSDAELMARLGQPDAHPEGRFFPDTYRYVRGMSDFELLRQAHARLQQVLAEEWAGRSPDLPTRRPTRR